MTKAEKRKYNREYHARRSPEKKKRKIWLQKVRLQKNLRVLHVIKGERGCADCGESDPVVLEFDHRIRKNKSLTLGEAARMGWSLKRLRSEILKCAVVCANCHRRRTAKQMRWYKLGVA